MKISLPIGVLECDTTECQRMEGILSLAVYALYNKRTNTQLPLIDSLLEMQNTLVMVRLNESNTEGRENSGN